MMNNYHAHVYFSESQRVTASRIVDLLVTIPDVYLWKIHDSKVGPHALPMMEVHFKEPLLGEVLRKIKSFEHDVTILVHKDTGNDFKDHENPIWIGKPLPLDFEFFHKVKADATLSIH